MQKLHEFLDIELLEKLVLLKLPIKGNMKISMESGQKSVHLDDLHQQKIQNL
jgi:hypothetical protein